MRLFLFGYLMITACTPAATVPSTTTTVPDKPAVPAVPESPVGRLLQFDMLTGSRTAEGYGNEHLLDNNLATAWVSRITPETPASIELILPKKEGEQKNSGSCVSQVGIIPGVFGNKSLEEQVSLPTEFQLEYTLVATQQNTAKKGKTSPKNKGPVAMNTTVQKVSATLPGTSSSDIQWLSVPELCNVLRMHLKITASLPKERPAVAITELYVVTK